MSQLVLKRAEIHSVGLGWAVLDVGNNAPVWQHLNARFRGIWELDMPQQMWLSIYTETVEFFPTAPRYYVQLIVPLLVYISLLYGVQHPGVAHTIHFIKKNLYEKNWIPRVAAPRSQM